MVRILHSADIHLDKPFVRLGNKGKERRSGLRRLFARLCQNAKDRADVMVLVGDIFEHDYIHPDTLNSVRKQLRDLAPMPVFIVPGNHDPCVKDSPYLLEQFPDNVHVFKTNTFSTVEIPEHNLVIHGIANTMFKDPNRYLKDYRVPKDGKLHVIVFHGSDMQSVQPQYEQETWFPFDEQDILDCGANYVALGHYHSFRCIPNDESKAKACYCGCPECLDRTDNDEKVALLVEVGENGNRIQKISVAEYQNDQVSLDCQGMSTREEIEQKLMALASEREWSKKIVRVTLHGEVDPGLDLCLEDIHAAVGESAFFLEIQNQTEFPYNLEELATRRDALGEFVRRMTARIEQGNLGEEDQRMARQALLVGIDAFMRSEVRAP